MIVAAGLTPAWQQMLLLDGLRAGEVNRAREARWCASGKVLNAGIALHHLGGPSVTVAPVGGMPGAAIEADLRSLGVPCRLLPARRPTRVCTTILDTHGGTTTTTELVENSQPADPDELEAFLHAFEEAARGASFVVLSGSLPPGAPATYYRELLVRTGAQAVVDARGPELLEALEARPFCVKPNREEVERTLGQELRSREDLRLAMEELHRRGASWVVVSEGSRALLALGEGRLRVFRPASVPTVNPIGCGDCLAAGIAWASRAAFSMPEAIRFGMAAAAENASELLPARLDLARVRARMSDVAEE